MNPFTDIKFVDLAINDLIGPFFAIFFLFAFGKLLLIIVDNFVAMLLMRLLGYRVHMTIRLNGAIATITRMGILSTHFQIINGSENRIEYVAVSNTRLAYNDIRRLVRVYSDDRAKKKGKTK